MMKKLLFTICWVTVGFCCLYLVNLTFFYNNNNVQSKFHKHHQQQQLLSILDDNNIENNNSSASSSYLVHTDQCIIPQMPLLHPDIRDHIQHYPNKHYHCIKSDIGDQIRRINYSSVFIPFELGPNCIVKDVVRIANDEDVKYGSMLIQGDQIQRPIHNFPNCDAVEVKCRIERNSELGIVYTRVIPLIPVKSPFKWNSIDSSYNQDPVTKVNILMIGIDAVSRLNLLRHMNLTAQFLVEHHFQSMLGHHKVGDNTLPNMFAMFLGEQQNEWGSRLSKNKKLDSLPFIFKHFSNAGYLTTYIEDYPNCGLFTFHGVKGFSGRQPTEYYLRPVNLLWNRNGLYDKMWCYGNKLEMEVRERETNNL